MYTKQTVQPSGTILGARGGGGEVLRRGVWCWMEKKESRVESNRRMRDVSADPERGGRGALTMARNRVGETTMMAELQASKQTGSGRGLFFSFSFILVSLRRDGLLKEKRMYRERTSCTLHKLIHPANRRCDASPFLFLDCHHTVMYASKIHLPPMCGRGDKCLQLAFPRAALSHPSRRSLLSVSLSPGWFEDCLRRKRSTKDRPLEKVYTQLKSFFL